MLYYGLGKWDVSGQVSRRLQAAVLLAKGLPQTEVARRHVIRGRVHDEVDQYRGLFKGSGHAEISGMTACELRAYFQSSTCPRMISIETRESDFTGAIPMRILAVDGPRSLTRFLEVRLVTVTAPGRSKTISEVVEKNDEDGFSPVAGPSAAK